MRTLAALTLAVLAPQTGMLGCGHESAPIAPCSAPPVPVEALDAPPELIRLDPPRYPEIARQQEHDGLVRIALVVDWDGSACEASLDASSGYPELDEAAMDAALTATYAPIRSRGKPVRTTVRIPIRFSLH